MSHKVLIVDDIKTNRELINSILQSSDSEFKTFMACDGQECYEKAISELPDIILLDLRMPKIEGTEVIKMLKKNEATKDIPVLILTAFNSPESVKESFDIGAFDYITKPIVPNELLSRIKKALGINEQIKQAQNKIAEIETEIIEYGNLALVTGHSQNSFIVIKTEGEMEWANEGFNKLRGYKLDEFKAKFGNTVFSLYQDTEIISLVNKCLTNKIPVEFTSKIRTKEGYEKWIQTFLSPKLSETNAVEKLIATEVDITTLKRKEEELNDQNHHMKIIMQNLEEANRMLEDQKAQLKKQKMLTQEEQEKSEKLLLNILPFEVAKQLKSKGTAGTRQYKTVSVLFADFKNFSNITKELEPKDLVNILDTYFAKFDEIIGRHYLEKIKTIGDAYMCAGGLPLRNKSNPFDAVLAGLEIQYYMNQLNDNKVVNNLSIWELRVGIHTGSVVAGVIGRKKFAYDIWGETVNVASRMEQSGHVGMVNISEVTYDFIKDFFECDYRGKIEAKNHGKIDMYFVNRLKTEYSKDSQGLIPNDHFISLVNRL